METTLGSKICGLTLMCTFFMRRCAFRKKNKKKIPCLSHFRGHWLLPVAAGKRAPPVPPVQNVQKLNLGKIISYSQRYRGQKLHKVALACIIYMLFKPFSRDFLANNHSVNYGGFQKVVGNCKKQDKMIHKWNDFFRKKYLQNIEIWKMNINTDRLLNVVYLEIWTYFCMLFV